MIIVTEQMLPSVIAELSSCNFIGLDTETTGLSSFHGDRIFSLALAAGSKTFYFNFQQYAEIPSAFILNKEVVFGKLQNIFSDPTKTWYIHNAKFDLHMLRAEGVVIDGRVACTYVGARLCNNLHHKLGLAEVAAEIGESKDSKVEEWIKFHGAYKKFARENKIFKQPDFTLVPFQLIAEYACKDAELTRKLGETQYKQIQEWNKQVGLPRSENVWELECEVTKVLLDMESVGAQIDVPFCRKALESCLQTMEQARLDFCKHTGHDYKSSGKMFAEVFEDEKTKWQYTEKGNPSFVAKVLRTFDSASAGCVLRYKDAKSEADFFGNFLTLADTRGSLHTSFNSGRARTGRMSSSGPNLQNLKRNKEVTEDEENSYQVRAAFIPRPGFFLAAIDYEQIEYRVMLDQAKALGLIAKVKSGLDVHEATAQIAKVTRQQAKTVNFLTLYGGGIKKLAGDLKVTEDEARAIQKSIFSAAPEIKYWISQTVKTAEHANIKFISNWFGRRYLFPATEKEFAYKAPNYVIQGGCADVLKIAMVKIAKYLSKRGGKTPLNSRMILTIHDEIVFEIAHGEEFVISDIAELMRTSYPHRHLPLDVDVEYSLHNLASMKPWTSFCSDPEITWEHGLQKARDQI